MTLIAFNSMGAIPATVITVSLPVLSKFKKPEAGSGDLARNDRE